MSDKAYDYLIVGAGLFGATFAYLAKKAGKKVLVIDKNPVIGGHIYTERKDGIDIHVYGAHIFHTDDERVWKFVNSFDEFNRFTNSPLANYKGKLYHLPFNMNTFYELFGTITPDEAKKRIEEEAAKEGISEDVSAETHALLKVGRTVYETLIKGYTEKQWGRSAAELPPYIVGRLPIRLTYDNNYFNDKYQGIPVDGYTSLISNMLDGIEVRLNSDFLKDRNSWINLADKVLYTGPIDAYFNYKLGLLEYRSLRFETKEFDTPNFQGNAVINYTKREVPYTRVIEHRHFMMNACKSDKTFVTYEYPMNWTGPKDEPYYPITNKRNLDLYHQYEELAKKENVIFGGRLGMYKYFDMDDTILACFDLATKEGIF